MKHGDLSIDLAPAVGFRFERLIKTEEGRLNKSVKAFIENVIGHLDANVYIITSGNERKCRAFLLKWGIVYTRVIEAESPLEIPSICIENRLATYYDYDLDILQNVRARGKDRVEAIQWTMQEVL